MTFGGTTTATQAVAEALYAALDGAISVPVYDFVPDGTSFPYVTIGDMTENRFGVHGRGGRTILAPIHVWSRYDGFAEARGVAAEIDTLLDRDINGFTVSGWRVVLIENENTRMIRQPDASGSGTGTATRHAILQYRIVVQKE